VDRASEVAVVGSFNLQVDRSLWGLYFASSATWTGPRTDTSTEVLSLANAGFIGGYVFRGRPAGHYQFAVPMDAGEGCSHGCQIHTPQDLPVSTGIAWDPTRPGVLLAWVDAEMP
jgi:hypothetical protein